MMMASGGDTFVTSGRTRAFFSLAWTPTPGLVGGDHRRVKRGQVTHHGLILFELVGMHGLGMLTKIVEA